MIKNIILILLSLSLISCYSTRHINANDNILKENNITINNKKNNRVKGVAKKEINSIIKQKPNKNILGFIPFHMWIYNLSNPEKNNWINSYLRKIGEEPIILDSMLVKKSVRQITSHFENNGYFTSNVTSVINYKKQKAYVTYKIETGESYLLNKISYNNIREKNIYDLIQKNKYNTEIKTGDLFTYNAVNNERIKIEELLQNNGFYKFSKELIYVNADSIEENKINLDFGLTTLDNDSSVYEKFTINQIHININNSESKDTIRHKDFDFIINNDTENHIKITTISNLIEINKNQFYSRKKTENTYRNLSNLNFFKHIVIEFVEINKNTNKLNCIIRLQNPTKMYYSIEAEAKRSADEGNLGISGYLQFGNKNLLKGAENLNGKIQVSLENRYTNIDDNTSLFNTKEITYELQLRVPKLILPKKLNNTLKKSFQMSTNLTFSFTNRKRPDFSSRVMTQKVGYSWNNSQNVQHQLNLIELSFSDIGEINSFIENELIENPYLSEQFEDKFIPASNYIFTFNNQEIYKVSNYTYLRTKAEISGNVFSTLGSIVNLNKNNDGNYLIFKNPFSQYLKLDIDIRRYLMFSKHNTLVIRGYYGLGYAYANSDELPIQKQFFSGGVNSIRAWEA
ncbi:MAG: hypothetical protein CMD23_03040, partial [Flavobacteriales bacterium]|nr:hypothetical protein [Flavobacteriales bacterium]